MQLTREVQTAAGNAGFDAAAFDDTDVVLDFVLGLHVSEGASSVTLRNFGIC